MVNADLPSKTKRGRKRSLIGLLFFVLLIGLWWGVPHYRMWRADAMVKELCAKDGGVKVYETVTLPPDKFDKSGQITFEYLSKGEDALGPDYLFRRGEQYIVESYPKIWRHHTQIFRRSDGKLLGDGVSYHRSGGDPLGPWEHSFFSCPDAVNMNIEGAIFKKGE